MTKLEKVRKRLHRKPELSGREVETSQFIEDLIKTYHPDEILRPGKTSRLFIFKGKEKGKVSVFRAELDALPIREIGDHSYQSESEGISHACGHDGHMTILAGLAERISKNRPRKGKVALLFQEAEETGQGASDLMEEKVLTSLKADRIFALHNIPGRKKHEILIRSGSFASASTGMEIHFDGISSHAGEPENGKNPAHAISMIIQMVNQENNMGLKRVQQYFATVINIQLGEIAYGTSPGEGYLRLTLRAYRNKELESLKSVISEWVEKFCRQENLYFKIRYCEEFPATMNHRLCIDQIRKAALENGLAIQEMEKPFRWSEDFGYYTRKIKGGFFGLGAGEDQAALHNPDYDFPDEIVSTGINMFYSIYSQNHL